MHGNIRGASPNAGMWDISPVLPNGSSHRRVGRDSPVPVEIGASPLISYGTSVASMSVRLHRRVLGGTTSVRISTTDGNLTLVDDVGGLSHSESGWVYLCRVVRTDAGEQYTLIRNGTVVDTQTRFEAPSKSVEETPRRLLLDGESTAQVVLPSLKVVPLVGGDPRATDDADRRYASGWRWRMYRRGGN